MSKQKGEFMLRPILVALAAMLLAPLPAAAQERGAWTTTAPAAVQREIARQAGDLRPFYAARGNAPLWLNSSGRPSGAASMLLVHLRTAQFDGVDPAKLKVERVARLLDNARRGDAGDQAKAEIELSRTFAAYVRAMRGANHAQMIYESPALEPVVPTVRSVLDGAARAAGLEDYVAEMRWMHPLYARLRVAMTDPQYSEVQRRQMWTNLSRIRAIPGTLGGRHVLVDAAGARLWMYEDGRAVDSMKVVVGKPELPTPMMAGFIRHAIVNPYWNVPPDLVRTTIAENVLAKGLGYLRGGGYQVLAYERPDAPVLDPKTIDWRAVHEGRTSAVVRQLPGGDNFMGKVKFEFPNAQGIFLHDTPAMDLMKLDARQQSSGCVRLEDAQRLGRWLMKGAMPTSRTPETKVSLPEIVPVYITYLTASPEANDTIAFRNDPYSRDGLQFAAVQTGRTRGDRP